MDFLRSESLSEDDGAAAVSISNWFSLAYGTDKFEFSTTFWKIRSCQLPDWVAVLVDTASYRCYIKENHGEVSYITRVSCWLSVTLTGLFQWSTNRGATFSVSGVLMSNVLYVHDLTITYKLVFFFITIGYLRLILIIWRSLGQEALARYQTL